LEADVCKKAWNKAEHLCRESSCGHVSPEIILHKKSVNENRKEKGRIAEDGIHSYRIGGGDG